MSEYHHVEKPFLDQLAALGWSAVDQGHGMIPSDPAGSLRGSFREWILPSVFRDAVRALNPWLTDRQLDDLRDQLLRHPNRTLLEAKVGEATTANPMHAAFEQLLRYRNGRPDTAAAGLREGEVRFFYSNLLLIRTCGEKAEFGTITSGHEHFHAWRDIWPECRREYTPPLGVEREQERMIQGLLAPDTLLDVLRTCAVVMDTDAGKRVKVVCRYQQYRAARRIVERLRTGKTPEERSGVVWHTQGSGKSLTMVFVARMLRHEAEAGRTDAMEGLSKEATTFYEYVAQLAFGSLEVPPELVPQMKSLSSRIVEILQRTIGIIDFWKKPIEVKQLRGTIDTEVLLAKIPQLSGRHERIAVEIVKLAEKRTGELMK